MGEWIAVADQLPELRACCEGSKELASDRVLAWARIASDTLEMNAVVLQLECDYEGTLTWTDGDEFFCPPAWVTHWMPLPDPPK